MALLRVELAGHPCVLLHEAYTLGDEMLAFGYPLGSTTGDPVTLVSEDWQRDQGASPDQPHVKLKQGQVQPGLSGGPLLNRRTGGVCGVVRLTRDRTSDLGGRAIPTSLVLDRYDFLIELQKAFHSRDRTWISLRGTERKWGDRNRGAMLEKVRSIWIDGFLGLLKETLFHDTRILLGLSERWTRWCPAAGPARAATGSGNSRCRRGRGSSMSSRDGAGGVAHPGSTRARGRRRLLLELAR